MDYSNKKESAEFQQAHFIMETKTPCHAGGSKKLLAMDKKNTPVVQYNQVWSTDYVRKELQ